MTTGDVIIKVEQGVGHITLNRPQALNALTQAMCEDMTAALLDWESDADVSEILLDHSGSRGFCAGGDVRVLYEGLRSGDPGVREFFRTEYRLNHLLFTYAKRITCVMDGIVMGGGAGIAMPCSKRIATVATQFAMPETGIGLFPDVGGGWYLSRLPGRMGEWVALTGTKLNGSDCLALGLATESAPGAQLPPRSIDKVRPHVDRLFAGASVPAILAALQADRSGFADAQLEIIRKRSPLACTVAIRQLRESRKLATFADNMKMEFRMVRRMLELPDFMEGIRAFIIDKDNAPRWSPADFSAVGAQSVEEIFAPLPEADEWTPLQRKL